MSPERRVIDITLPIRDGLPTWPGDPPLRLERVASIADGDGFDVSLLSTSVHVGTHVDAPRHAIADGDDAARMPLETLVGEAVVVDVGDGEHVDAAALEATVPRDVTRVLLRTRNSRPSPTDEGSDPSAVSNGFRTDFAALRPGAARWLVDQGVKLIGIDGPSIAPWEDLATPHRILLGAGIVVVEGLVLSHVEPGRYDLCCLPLPLVDSDGAPARAVLLPRD